MKLAPKQQRFVDEYLVDCNGARAAREAGYAEGSAHVEASRLLRNAKVRAAIQQAMNERSQQCLVDSNFVLRNLVEVVNRCMAAGEEFNPHGANRALSLLCLHFGLGLQVEEQVRGEANGFTLEDAEERADEILDAYELICRPGRSMGGVN